MTTEDSLKLKAAYRFDQGLRRPGTISGKVDLLAALMLNAAATGDCRIMERWLPEQAQDRE